MHPVVASASITYPEALPDGMLVRNDAQLSITSMPFSFTAQPLHTT
jgi:hypothetical protein